MTKLQPAEQLKRSAGTLMTKRRESWIAAQYISVLLRSGNTIVAERQWLHNRHRESNDFAVAGAERDRFGVSVLFADPSALANPEVWH